MSIELKHGECDLGDVRLHYVRAGQGPTVVLLHGWPQTWLAWREVIARLAASGFDVIAVDLRGAGGSSKPADSYDSNTVASDIHRLMEKLGVASYHIVGHDNGGRIAYAVAANYRGEVKSLVFLESKVLGIQRESDVHDEYWHFGFHQMPGLPEAVLIGKEREYLGWFFGLTVKPGAIKPEDIDAYVAAYKQPGAMEAGLAYYRAFPATGAQSRELSKQALTIPVLAYGGSASMGTGPYESMRLVAQHVNGGVIDECGHWIPEEKPEWLADQLIHFFHTV